MSIVALEVAHKDLHELYENDDLRGSKLTRGSRFKLDMFRSGKCRGNVGEKYGGWKKSCTS